MTEELVIADAAPQNPNHTIHESRDWEKILVAAEPALKELGKALVEKTRIEHEATTHQVKLAEERQIKQSRNGLIGVMVIAVAAAGLAGCAVFTGNAALAEKVVFGLFAFVGGFAARR